ncbi:hypothetical protein [Methylobacterium sp. 13MFTsu3.1M2]|uniref:hypothetical protein n=1 Tax=Methylobacterium sp. 13MFTsu3.1M2 TaxID=1502776 RepID=UPI0008E91CC8|nr:hypothetical protein [Methylobacterium sp. 13MFTsu3.1M2]SFE91944.1 hypothetical protein SAMN02799627_04718 [Methylobacterium sp. 13MFTsu3.1M2]
MDEETWANALTPRLMDAVRQRIGHRKNRNAVIDMFRWTVASNLWHRTKKGFHLVRGSDSGGQDGLKMDPFLQSLGLTEGKIRGAIKTLLEDEIIEVIPQVFAPRRDGKLWRWNHRLQKRNPPLLYRFKPWIQDLIRRESRQTADSSSSVASSLLTDLSRNSSGIKNENHITGNLVGLMAKVARKPTTGPVANPGAPFAGAVGAAVERMHRAMFRPSMGSVHPASLAATGQEAPVHADRTQYTARDADWLDRWAHVVEVPLFDHPRVYGLEPMEGEHPRRTIHGPPGIHSAVLAWLDYNVGIAGAAYAVHWFMQNVRSDSRDIRVGFRDATAAIAFSMRWCGR